MASTGNRAYHDVERKPKRRQMERSGKNKASKKRKDADKNRKSAWRMKGWI